MEKKIIALCLIGLILLFGCVSSNNSVISVQDNNFVSDNNIINFPDEKDNNFVGNNSGPTDYNVGGVFLPIVNITEQKRISAEELVVSDAIKSRDITKCDSISEKNKDVCINGIAYILNNSALCEEIKDIFIKENCIKKIRN